MGGKGHPDKLSDGNEENVIENLRKDSFCYKVVKSLAELSLCPSVYLKIEL